MATPVITGSGANSTVLLGTIHQGTNYFRKDTSTTHSQVMLLQQELANRGYLNDVVDGKYGNNTFNAVKAFQSANGLTSDGLFGQASLNKLEELLDHHLDDPSDCTRTSFSGSDSGSESGGNQGDDDNPTFITGQFGRTTKTGVRVRTAPGSNSFYQVTKGSMFLIEGTQTGPTISGSNSNLWVKVRFGKGDGGYEHRYIHSSCFGDPVIIGNSVLNRIVAIAQTLVNNTGSNLGMSGNWCQRFIYWLCGACGISNISMPYSEGYCGQARLKMVNLYGAQWHQRGDGFVPYVGDLIYFGELNSDISSHVGLVYQSGSDFKTVEGNLSDKVQLRTGSVSTGMCGNRLYQGFLRLNV